MISRKTSLTGNIVQFCQFLRQKGFAAGVKEEGTVLQGLQFINYSSPTIFHLALKATLCKNKTQLEEFDELFNEYWKQIDKAVNSKIKQEPKKKPGAQPASLQAIKTWLHGNRNDETVETATYSHHENLSHKDFSAVPESGVEELMQIIRAMARRLAAKASRRYKFSHNTDMPDLRQTLRKSLRRGGELLDLAYRKPKQTRTKILLLCDTSKSMELYTVFLLQFMYAFQQVYRRMETFVFGTSLKRITPFLREQKFHAALHMLENENDWMGGTRIGECLQLFVKNYGKKMLDSKTIVIIVSDGWDQGNMDILRQSMAFIKARSKKIIWLNPLAGFANYKPETTGMQTAMPFIDVFAPVHNVASLQRLSKWL
ncbi:vWA domain-containing protein [Terrimonas alba]|uniref:vWA domain-containing protein n=1 Tax=Terrimonas alba TaxID=3349636 RepID=UPI0035F464E0